MRVERRGGSRAALVGPELAHAERRLPVRAVAARGARADLHEPPAAAEQLVGVVRPGREAVLDAEPLREQIGVRVGLHDAPAVRARARERRRRPATRSSDRRRGRTASTRGFSGEARGRARARRSRAARPAARRARPAQVRVQRRARRAPSAPRESISSWRSCGTTNTSPMSTSPAARARAGESGILARAAVRGSPAGRGSRRAGSRRRRRTGCRGGRRARAAMPGEVLAPARPDLVVGRGAVEPALQRELLGLAGRDEVDAAARGAEEESSSSSRHAENLATSAARASRRALTPCHAAHELDERADREPGAALRDVAALLRRVRRARRCRGAPRACPSRTRGGSAPR